MEKVFKLSLLTISIWSKGEMAGPLPFKPDCIAQSVAHLTQEPEVPGSIPGPATYIVLSFLLP